MGAFEKGSIATTLVTGAAGTVGREVVRALIRRGGAVVAADHRKGRIEALFDGAVTPAGLDFCDASTWVPSFNGATQMFLVRPPAISDVQNTLNPFIDCARANGVDHVVFLSVAGAGKNRLVPHRKVEDHLRSLGDHHTNLRPGFFAQNLETAYREDISKDDRIYVPAGTASVNWIDVRDIAEVAAAVLSEPEQHRGMNYTLAGPGPVSWSTVTGALTANLGRTIRYEPASVLGYVRHLARRGEPRGAIAIQTVLHFLLRFGQGAGVAPDLEKILGRPGGSIAQYIADNSRLWAKPPDPISTATAR